MTQVTADPFAEQLRELGTQLEGTASASPWPRMASTGAEFILDAPAHVPAVWGEGERVVWAQGEPLLLVGPSGVGKTTVAQQVTLARIGLRKQVLGLPLCVDRRRVLYIAADRPPQAARSFARMVSEADRDVLTDRLVIWRGPPPFDLATDPQRLQAMAQHFDAGTVVIDSLKDIALDLSEDRTGSRVNLALQATAAAGVEILVLHHQRKASVGNTKPRGLADVYGSTWLTAGAGSVLLLWGEAGDPVVELRHLKQPAAEVGPLRVLHDHERGSSSVQDEVDLRALVEASDEGLTAVAAARLLFDSSVPDRNKIEKARRRLEALCRSGHAYREDGSAGGLDGGHATRYVRVSLLSRGAA